MPTMCSQAFSTQPKREVCGNLITLGKTTSALGYSCLLKALSLCLEPLGLNASHLLTHPHVKGQRQNPRSGLGCRASFQPCTGERPARQLQAAPTPAPRKQCSSSFNLEAHQTLEKASSMRDELRRIHTEQLITVEIRKGTF